MGGAYCWGCRGTDTRIYAKAPGTTVLRCSYCHYEQPLTSTYMGGIRNQMRPELLDEADTIGAASGAESKANAAALAQPRAAHSATLPHPAQEGE